MTFDARMEAWALCRAVGIAPDNGDVLTALERAYVADRDRPSCKACGIVFGHDCPALASPPPGTEPCEESALCLDCGMRSGENAQHDYLHPFRPAPIRTVERAVEDLERRANRERAHAYAYGCELRGTTMVHSIGCDAITKWLDDALGACAGLRGGIKSQARHLAKAKGERDALRRQLEGDSTLPDRIRTFVAAHENDGGAAYVRIKLVADLVAAESSIRAAGGAHWDPPYVEARALLAAAYEETASRCRVLIEAAKGKETT